MFGIGSSFFIRRWMLGVRCWTFICSTFILITLITINAHSAQVTLISPTGTISDPTPSYTWHAVSGATRYHLIAKDSFGRKINEVYTTEQSGCKSGDGICSVTPETNFSNGPCKWRVRTWNGDGYGPWSDTMVFSLDQ